MHAKNKAIRQLGATQPKRTAAKPTLADLKRWATEDRASLLEKAKANCVRLTGKPSFGSK